MSLKPLFLFTHFLCFFTRNFQMEKLAELHSKTSLQYVAFKSPLICIEKFGYECQPPETVPSLMSVPRVLSYPNKLTLFGLKLIKKHHLYGFCLGENH